MSGGVIEYILHTGEKKPVQFRIDLDYVAKPIKLSDVPEWAYLKTINVHTARCQ